ncbi:hypothetical protein [Streptomyces sp.]|uniref:hypothetical protein n=1 Tax=Streptomyces sp. TaxID=1931 RepID=UPI002D793B6F|nr:hypothetical protein [Streptomyces sp.]HET6359174.1 hypothetical protein [Streptomyces sp.]
MTRQTSTAAWPASVLFRFLTIGGATVDISPTDGPGCHRAHCNGCAATSQTRRGSDGLANSVKPWAQAHAETCRAMPRPTV